MQQRTPDLPHREVEGIRVTLRPHPYLRQAGIQRLHQLGDVVVGDRHPLGHTGGARGVVDVGNVIGGRRRWRGAGLGVNAGVVDLDDHHVMPVEPRPQVCGGDRGDRGGIGNHEPDPRRRQPRIDRQVGRPGLEHRHNRHDRLDRTRQQQRHTLSRTRPLSGQQVRQPVGGLLQLPIGPRPLPAADRHRLRGARHLRGEQCWNRHRRGCGLGQHRPVTDLIQPGMLTRIQHIHRRQRPGAGRRSSPPTPAPTAQSAPRC